MTTATHTVFPVHTLESAPVASRKAMESTARRLGGLPDVVAMLATSPELLTGFLSMSSSFDSTSLDPLAREVVVLTVATRNECAICVAMHTARLVALDADQDLIDRLRSRQALSDERLEAVRRFSLAVLDTAGKVDDADLASFLAAGLTARQALEVVFGVGVYTMSTFANRLTRAPVDPSLEAYAWTPDAR